MSWAKEVIHKWSGSWAKLLWCKFKREIQFKCSYRNSIFRSSCGWACILDNGAHGGGWRARTTGGKIAISGTN